MSKKFEKRTFKEKRSDKNSFSNLVLFEKLFFA